VAKVGAIDDPVWALPMPHPVEKSPTPMPRAERRFMIGAIALVPILLGCLGWMLPSVGGSVVIPAVIVFGTGLLIVIIATAVAMDRPRWRPFAISAVIATVLMSIWTFEFSLSMQIQFSNATAQARAAIESSHGVPTCSMHVRGSVGPLSAPYRECVSGQMVTFTRAGTTQGGGLIYASNGVTGLQDACVFTLLDDWMMFASDATSCPQGYNFIPGP